MTDKDKITRTILLEVGKLFPVGLLTNGDVVVSTPEYDYTVKLTRKKERIL